MSQLKNGDCKSVIDNDCIRILHVDDDPSILEVSKDILMDMGGFEVDFACCVDEALQKLKQQTYDVVVSDYEMPQKDGLNFLEELRGKRNGVPFILFTGKGREEVAIKALNLGADGYYNKQGQPKTVYGELAHGISLAVAGTRVKSDLAESKFKFSTIADFAHDWVYWIDPARQIVYVSPSCKRITGYSVQEFIKDPQLLSRIVSPQDATLVGSHFDLITQEKENVFEFRIRTKRGETRWISHVCQPIFDNKGNWLGRRAANRDITERKKAEEALRVSEEKFSKAFQKSPSAIVLIRMTDGAILEANQSVLDILGYSREEMLGRTALELGVWANPDDRIQFTSELCAKGFVGNQEFAMRKKDGTKGTLNVSAETFEIEGERHVLVAFIDITKQKEADKALKRSEARFRDLAESISDVFFALDNDLRYTYWNMASTKLTGISAKDAIGKSLTEVFPDVKDTEVEQFYQNVLRTKQDQNFVSKYRIGEKDVIFEIDAYPTKDGISVFTKDITERKKAEEELNQIMDQLVLVNEKLGVVGSLTRHDVGNKLMTAKSNIYLLKKRLGDRPELAKYFDGVESALTASDRIFEFSRLYERIGVEKLLTVNIFGCFNEAVAMMPSLGAVKVVNECQGLEVVADSLLKQLFYNFIDNSLKHGEKVTQVRLYYTKEGDELKLFYEDDGVGVPETNKPKLFDGGFSTGKGSGLGLYLIKKMMDVYGWTITEEGEPGKGAKFVIRFPPNELNSKWFFKHE